MPSRPHGSDAGSFDDPATLPHRWLWRVALESPDAAYRRLLEHDSIHLQELIPAQLRRRHHLLDAERVFKRAAARAAYSASLEERGLEGPWEAWLEARIDEGIADCLTEDQRRFDAGEPDPDPLERHGHFHWIYMVPEEHVLRASVRFNGLEPILRRSFFELLIERRTPEECVANGLGPAPLLAERVRTALDAAADIGADREPDDAHAG